MKDSELRDLLEDRYDHRPPSSPRSSTRRWHELLTDAPHRRCDRLVHNAHVVALQAPAMRERKGTDAVKPTSTRRSITVPPTAAHPHQRLDPSLRSNVLKWTGIRA